VGGGVGGILPLELRHRDASLLKGARLYGKKKGGGGGAGKQEEHGGVHRKLTVSRIGTFCVWRTEREGERQTDREREGGKEGERDRETDTETDMLVFFIYF
jgi:hypothetical protein